MASQAREVGERWFDVVSGGDRDAARALLADGVDFYAPSVEASSVDEIVEALLGYSVAIPDARFEIARWHEARDTAVAEGVYRGTHTGPLRTPQGEVPATGRQIAIPLTTVVAARDGKLTVHRAYWDNLTFMGQLGLA